MIERRTIADYVAAAGLCLLVLAAVDGAIELFEFVTSINLWKTCGTIGLLLLVVINVALGIFEPDSALRRNGRKVAVWYRERLRKRAAAPRELGNEASIAAR